MASPAAPHQQVKLVALLLKGGMRPADVARCVGWDSKDVARLQAQLRLEEATDGAGAASAAMVPAEPPATVAQAPGAVADAAPVVPAWVQERQAAERVPAKAPRPEVAAAEVPAAPEQPFHRRLGPPAQQGTGRPSLLRAMLDWMMPVDGAPQAPLPWRALLPWAGGVAAAVLVAATVLPRGPSSVPLVSTTPAHYRCQLPSGAVVLTTSQADCTSVLAGLRQPQQSSVPTVATIAPAAAPPSSASTGMGTSTRTSTGASTPTGTAPTSAVHPAPTAKAPAAATAATPAPTAAQVAVAACLVRNGLSQTVAITDAVEPSAQGSLLNACRADSQYQLPQQQVASAQPCTFGGKPAACPAGVAPGTALCLSTQSPFVPTTPCSVALAEARQAAAAAAKQPGSVGYLKLTCIQNCNQTEMTVGTPIGSSGSGSSSSGSDLPPPPHTSWLVKMGECAITHSWGVAGTGCP